MTTSDAQAKEVACPKCKAQRQQPCTYVADQTKWVRIDKENWNSYRNRTYYVNNNWAKVTINKKGDACKSVHNERRNKAHKKYIASLYANAPAPAPTTALQSLNAFDQFEYEQLRNWLRTNSSIFNKKD